MNRTYEPPLSQPGALLEPLDELFPGVRGYAVERNGEIWIPLVEFEHPGDGNVGCMLDVLSPRCRIVNVCTDILRDMLQRRGWVMSTTETDDGDAVDVWRPAEAVRYAYEPDYAVPPGATLQETIDSLGMTQRELALRTGMAPKTINEIINGKAPITPATSILLERVTGIPARMWNNLESNYREQLALKADRDRLRRELDDTKAQLEACEIWRDRLRVEAAKARQTECPNCDRLQRELDEARAQVAKGKP